MSLLLTGHDRRYLVAPGDRVETDLGVIEVPDSVDPPASVQSHLGKEFALLRPRNTDFFDLLERTGAPMVPRDIGLVVGLTGLGAGDRVLDVGTGSGILAVTLGRLGMRVDTYERDHEKVETARENVARVGLDDRVTVHHEDATEAELGDGFDGLTLDTEDAPTLVATAGRRLVPGGVMAAYTPFVEQARSVAEAAEDAELAEIRTHETIQRTMDFDQRGSRPSTGPVGHTGYMTLGRHLPTER